MSTLKVANIESQSGGGVSAKISDVGGGPLSNRNLIINGAMQVSQRTTSETGITTNKYSACDRFQIYPINLGTWTASQETSGFSDTWEATATERFRTYLKVLCTTADASPAAADQMFLLYHVESQDLRSLQYGTAQAKPAILSFWVKSNKTGNASVSILQYQNSNRQLPVQYTINAADTWEYKTITLPADTSGSFNYDNGIGFQVYWYMNSGSNNTGGSHSTTWQTYDATSSNASNLGVGGAVNDYFAITGVQLEVSDFASTFEHRSYGDDLARCQRYYIEYNYGGSSGTPIAAHYGAAVSTNSWIYAYGYFPTVMRDTPAFKTSDLAGNEEKLSIYTSGGGATTDNITPYTDDATTHGFNFSDYANAKRGIAIKGYKADAEL